MCKTNKQTKKFEKEKNVNPEGRLYNFPGGLFSDTYQKP